MFPNTQLIRGNRRLRQPAENKWKAGGKNIPAAMQTQKEASNVSMAQFGYDGTFEPIKAISSMDKAVKKSISFRIVATMGTFAVAWVFTGNPFMSVGVASAQAITNTTIYYFHEKHWESKEKS